MKLLNNKNLADFAGIASSGLCLIHCLATPLLIALSFSPNHQMQHWLGMVFLLVSFIMVILTSLENHSTPLSLLLFFSFLGLSAGTYFEHSYFWAPYLMWGSSFLLIIGHGLNIWLCRRQHKGVRLSAH